MLETDADLSLTLPVSIITADVSFVILRLTLDTELQHVSDPSTCRNFAYGALTFPNQPRDVRITCHLAMRHLLYRLADCCMPQPCFL